MKTGDIINFLETVAPPSLQEGYDNAGLIYGSPDLFCTGILVCLDITDEVIEDASAKGFNLIIAHHPMVFRSLKKFDPSQPVTRLLVKAIKREISIYAIHTNLDNQLFGVNGRIAEILGLKNISILQPKQGLLKKLYCFVPNDHAEKVKNALFEAGAGHIGNYSECSFISEGKGTFTAGRETHPFAGEIGTRHTEPEMKLEMIFPAYLESALFRAMRESHPYEEIAYDIVSLDNLHQNTGSGLVGDLNESIDFQSFFRTIKEKFLVPLIRHSPLINGKVKKVALCGGAGSFLISNAIRSGAEVFLTADLKYHDFFEADGKIVLADMGHYESEQFTSDLLVDLLKQKFPTFAVLKTGVVTNPVNYFL